MNPSKKPFKLISHDRQSKKGVVAGSLEELFTKAKTNFARSEDPRMVLEEDGTEIVEDDYLLSLQDNTKLMALFGDQKWTACSLLPCDETDHHNQHYNPVKILQKLARSPGTIALLSEEELTAVVHNPTPTNIGIPESELSYLKEACERELEQKKRVKDALDLVELYQRAKQQSDNVILIEFLEEAVTEMEGDSNLNSSILNPDGRKEKSANYLKCVKGSLDASSYKAFSSMTSKYRKDKDVEDLLESLTNIFLNRSTALRHLFRDYRQFVNKEHASRFDRECKKHQIV